VFTALSVMLLLAVPPQAAPRLRLELAFDGCPESPAVITSAVAEAARVWARYGVDIRVPSDDAIEGTRSIQVRVRFAEPQRRGTAANSIGLILFHDGEPEPVITLYPATAWELMLGSVGAAPASWPLHYRDIVVGRVLGKALAHEVGHFLLGHQHSQKGLMRACHSIADLMEIDDRRLSLSAGEQAQLVARFEHSPATQRGAG
jgi:hypothetical protein